MRVWAINLTFEEETMKIVCTKADALNLARLCEDTILEDCCQDCILQSFCKAAETDEDTIGIDHLIEIENEK